jgi:hypothetical protein
MGAASVSAGLPKSIAPDHEAWDLAGTIFRPNLLKVTQRRHFALTCNHDESHRITVDLSRDVFKIGAGASCISDTPTKAKSELPVQD